jgi:alpha-maltose-1-phosphate synthase
MNLLILCEGDPETRDSWSGTSLSLVEAFRSKGVTVIPGDVDLYGPSRWMVGALTFSTSRRRWWAKYHLSGPAFAMRSRKAAGLVSQKVNAVHAVLQFGATFEVQLPRGIGYYLYCDSNIRVSEMASTTGVSEASGLVNKEIAQIAERESGVYRRADKIFAMSRFVAESFVSQFHVDPKKVLAVHGGPNLSLENQDGSGPQREVHPPTVLFVGRAFERKGGPLLLKAFAKVLATLPGARLTVIGPELPPEGLPHELEGSVDWVGFLDKDSPGDKARLEAAYRSATVFCLPTRFEPFGVVFLEAMMFGLPCIGPRAWAVPEIIDHGRTGLLFTPNSAPSLAEELLKVLGQPDLARRMGDAGRKRVSDGFTWSHVVERMLAEMKELAVP